MKRTVVITGASGGLGEALAFEASERGYAVAMADIDKDNAENVAEKLESETLVRKVDISSPEQVDHFANEVFKKFGRVDLLFNNAGVFNTGTILDSSPESWSRIMDINFFGTLHGVRAFVPHMIESQIQAKVINTSSISGLYTFPNVGAYSISKHAVTALSETLQKELIEKYTDVRVSVVCPSGIKTNISDPDRYGDTFSRSGDADLFLAKMRESLAKNGMDPAHLVNIIFDQAMAGKFWIIPENVSLDPVLIRARSILDRSNPVHQNTNHTTLR